ncbi:hypothetical protein HOC37_06305 [bacterium]|jgi:hypothetical protein|nr:hypothetical protein [bacterium]MBT3581110.1 hypothetical protein [bacterium]MBT4552571.1 hypothetical protein [bacterium]MBT5988234.1 hypothetical protein [bacterium]MBT7087921.1 hypothetical protein [bacterium]
MKKILIISFLFFSILGFSIQTVQAESVYDLVKFGKDIKINQNMRVGDAVAIGGNIDVNGIVEGNVVCIGGDIQLGPDALIAGKIVSIGGTINKEQGSEVIQKVIEINVPMIRQMTAYSQSHTLGASILLFKLVSFLSFLALAMILVILIPKILQNINHQIHTHALRTIIWGTIGTLLIIPTIIFLILSVFGIVLIPLEIIFIAASFFIGYVALSSIIGEKICHYFRKNKIHLIWQTILGLIVLGLLSWVPIFGPIIKIISFLFGFGGVLYALVHLNYKT